MDVCADRRSLKGCVCEHGRLQTTVEDCLQSSEASCSYESRDLVLYRGFIGAVVYLCGPNRRGVFFRFSYITRSGKDDTGEDIITMLQKFKVASLNLGHPVDRKLIAYSKFLWQTICHNTVFMYINSNITRWTGQSPT